MKRWLILYVHGWAIGAAQTTRCPRPETFTTASDGLISPIRIFRGPTGGNIVLVHLRVCIQGVTRLATEAHCPGAQGRIEGEELNVRTGVAPSPSG